MLRWRLGVGFAAEECLTLPADVLAANWMMGKPAAFYITANFK